MDILLWILGAIVFVVIGIPAALILVVLVLYLVFILFYAIVIFIVGIACIPASLANRIAGNKDKKNKRYKFLK